MTQLKEPTRDEKRVTFAPGDWIWIHFGKESFPSKIKNKLMPRRDGPFQVLENIGDNAYKVDLPSEYLVHNVFNFSDLSLLDVGVANSRTSSFEEGESDVDQSDTTSRRQTKYLHALQAL